MTDSFKELRLLQKGAHTEIYVHPAGSHGQPEIYKVLHTQHPAPQELAQLNNEYDILKDLKAPCIRQVFRKTALDGRSAMVMEYIEGTPLRRMIRERSLTLTQQISIAADIAQSLGYVHDARIIHKDVNSSNILVIETQGAFTVKLIDFGISSKLDLKFQHSGHPDALEGTLAYISPEQTGRMNRVVDYRTDLYSLGVTLYELFTGRLPFETQDTMELIHCHLAKQPIPPHQVSADVPPVISRIISRLLAKDADERYQSALGVKYDLNAVLEYGGDLHQMTLDMGQQDFSDRFRLPQKLYGREDTLAPLFAAFEQMTQRKSELLLVAGYSGIGKTAVVRELYKPLTEKRGYFISGKFDQFQRNVPYSAVIQAFRDLMRQLLTEPQAQLDSWKTRLLAALGSNGQVITDVIAEVELITGPQPAVPALPPTESQNRFNLVFQNFIRVFCQADHPLVIFMDDLQWIDSASLQLMTMMMNDIPWLLLIGAYRDNEVSPAHPLMTTLDGMRQQGIHVQTLTLTPLSLPHLNQFVSDTLMLPTVQTLPLAELVLEKTGGNPFFMGEFLKTLHSEGLIRFDSSQHEWRWDLVKIRLRNITDNVVELMTGKIQRLAAATQQVLTMSAAVGNQFDIGTLSVVSQQSPEWVKTALWEALADGLVVPSGEIYRFVHDRVQQAAYALISESDRPALHLRIGQLLLKEPTGLRERLFEIIDHLNLGLPLLTAPEARHEAAQLNLRAGRQARNSAAFEAAFNYALSGLELLDPDSWDTQYELTLELHTLAAETASLTGNFESLDRFFVLITRHAKTDLDMSGVYESKVDSYVRQGQLQEALDTALEILERLGLSLPAHPADADFQHALQELQSSYAHLSIEDLVNLPEMTDKRKLSIMHIASKSSAAAYIGRPALCLVMVLEQTRLSTMYGNTSESSYMYAAYGWILCGVTGDIDSGYRFGQLAVALLEKTGDTKFKSKVMEVVNGHIWHYKGDLRNTLPNLKTGYQSGLETGDLEYAGYNTFFYCCNAYLSGKELSRLEKEMEVYHEDMLQIRNETALRWQAPFWQAVLNLLGQSESPVRLDGKGFPQEEMLPVLKQTNNQSALAAVYMNSLVLCYLFEDYEKALENAELAEQHKIGMAAMVSVAVTTFYDSLTRLQLCPGTSETEQSQYLRQVSANQEKMAQWAQLAPMNHQHKYDLVEAEKARVSGQFELAAKGYEKAIAGAKKNEYLQEEALAYELAAKFYLSQGMEKFARNYLTEAYYCCERWGASAKLRHLEQRYPRWLPPQRPAETKTFSAGTVVTGTTEFIDVATLVKASQTISQEISLEKVLKSLMRLVVENAGAEKGALVLKEGENWLIQAQVASGGRVQVLQGIPLCDAALPSTVVEYVKRTGESIVLADAASDSLFNKDAYIRQQQIRSLLCQPIRYQGEVTGLLCLENNLAADVFTPSRLELLKVLSSQAAISIEIARHIRNMAEQERLKSEMELARKIQTVLLPKNPLISGYEIAVSMDPAEEVGGDYYDVISVAGFDWIVIGDVSGHGVTAGLVMMMVQTSIHTVLIQNPEVPPPHLLSVINRAIYENLVKMDESKHMTIVVLACGKDGFFDFSGRHEDILFWCAETRKVESIETDGMWIGLDEDISGMLPVNEFRLGTGDCLILYTDGIIEARGKDGKFFGTERLTAIIEAAGGKSASEIHAAILNGIRDFEKPDDVTLFVMKRV